MTTQGSNQKKIEEILLKYRKGIEWLNDATDETTVKAEDILAHQPTLDAITDLFAEALEAQRQEYKEELWKLKQDYAEKRDVANEEMQADHGSGRQYHFYAGNVSGLSDAINLIDQPEKEGGDK